MSLKDILSPNFNVEGNTTHKNLTGLHVINKVVGGGSSATEVTVAHEGIIG